MPSTMREKHAVRNDCTVQYDAASSVAQTGDVSSPVRAIVVVQSAEEIAIARGRALTARQKAVLDFIRDVIRREGIPPTLREIGKAFGIRSTNGVNDHLRALERKGCIRRRDMLSRSIVVVGGEPIPSGSIAEWRNEDHAMRVLLARVVRAAERAPTITAEMAVVLGDVRQVLKGRPV